MRNLIHRIMKTDSRILNLTSEIIAYLYILLFVYAAVSKMLDFENFRVQLGQSPLLNAYAGIIAWMIPFLEILIALLLVFKASRRIGLLASLGLMVMFTAYIFLILNFSSYVPCSCGGILENMGWNEHLYFNIAFSFLAIGGLLILYNNKRRAVIGASGVAMGSLIFMAGLFFSSDMIIHRHNNFVRKYSPETVGFDGGKDLKYNGYYFAGKGNGKIYLGNRTAPAVITEIDERLSITRDYHIRIADTLYRFLNVQLRVQPPYFYIFDGTVPCVFKGRLADGRAVLQSDKAHGFTKAEVVDSTSMIIRSINDSRENIMATLSIPEGKIVNFAPEILQKQIDGLFDTDGTLQYSEGQQKFVYLYYYRNQYIVTDRHLGLLHRGNTIDTTSKAKIEVKYLEQRNVKKFSAPPLMVNKMSALHNNLLFVNSALPGRFDVRKMWERASVIDVYDILTSTYVMSFYINDIGGGKMSDFLVTDSHVFALLGRQIVSYRLGNELKAHYKK